MPVKVAEVSRDEAAPEAKSKALTDFEQQNPAAKKLAEEVDEAMDIMLQSLVKEIRAVLEPNAD
jgi:hypothetical protein